MPDRDADGITPPTAKPDPGAPAGPSATAENRSVPPTGVQTKDDLAYRERAAVIDRETQLEVGLSETLRTLRDHLVAAFDQLEVDAFRGELTLIAPPDRLVDLLAFCRDDPAVDCQLLADLSGVHWPAGRRDVNAQETTGWPTYEVDEGPGRIELDYVLYSLTHHHRLRIRVYLPDDTPAIASATGIYSAAHAMEREAYDFFGVAFEGHPNLVRILMPEEWEGHPHRKDYPLGGVEVLYKGATVPPPDERDY